VGADLGGVEVVVGDEGAVMVGVNLEAAQVPLYLTNFGRASTGSAMGFLGVACPVRCRCYLVVGLILSCPWFIVWQWWGCAEQAAGVNPPLPIHARA
jgi:hypothetical protein